MTKFKDDLFIGLINLRTRPERLDFFKKGLARQLGTDDIFGAKVHYHIVDKDPESGVLGCTRSHMAIYKMALDAKCKAAIVFEDDVTLNGYFTREFLEECMEQIKFWDIIRFHKTGICKIHGAISPKFYHSSSVCGRAYLISPQLMEYVLKHDSKEVVPYTWFLPKASARQLTYDPTPITEGAYGSDNSKGFGADPALAFIQKSLDYTIWVEQAIANFQWYGILPQSPLFKEESFPTAHTLRSECRSEKISIEDYKAKIGPYWTLSRSDMLRALPRRIASSFYFWLIFMALITYRFVG